MKYGIMGAMPDEVDQLCARLSGVEVQQYAGVEYHQGRLGDKEVVVCCAGMGKANAAATTQVVGKEVCYHDAEVSMICQSAPFLKSYTGDPALVQAALDACAALGVKAIAGRIATGDTFVGDGATKAVIAEKVHPDCVEMEGAAVSQIAARNGVPCVVLRAMSDNADESGHELLVVKKFSIAEYVTTATAIVARMLESL